MSEVNASPALLTIPQLAGLTQTKVSYWYEQSRKGLIPGQVKIGKKFVRIDREQFFAALKTERAACNRNPGHF